MRAHSVLLSKKNLKAMSFKQRNHEPQEFGHHGLRRSFSGSDKPIFRSSYRTPHDLSRRTGLAYLPEERWGQTKQIHSHKQLVNMS